MSIAELKKVTLIGLETERRSIMSQLQDAGVMHIIPLKETQQQADDGLGLKLREALEYLLRTPQQRRKQYTGTESALDVIVDRVIDNKQKVSQLRDQIEVLKQQRKTLANWGNFEPPQGDEIGPYQLYLSKVPLSGKSALFELDCAWTIINQDHKFHYVVFIATSEQIFSTYPFAFWQPTASLATLARQQNEAEIELDEQLAKRQGLTRWLSVLSTSLTDTLNESSLERAEQATLQCDPVFAIQGWVPTRQLQQLSHLNQAHPMTVKIEEVAPDEHPPTQLHNRPWLSGGQAAVAFFQLPGYRTWDPSALIFFSFSLFFAMILADAGYALVLATFVLFKWRRWGRSETAKRNRYLALTLVSCSVVYGMLVGSYFGVTPSPGEPLAYVHCLDMSDFNGMMKIAIGAGSLHLILANLMVAWIHRREAYCLSALGWVMLIATSYSGWLAYLGSTSESQTSLFNTPYGWFGLGALLLIFCFSGTTSPQSGTGLVKRTQAGLQAWYSISKAFGDVLSYMRLFALGLSSASLAVTFNDLAVQARDAVPAGGPLLFALIVLLGHGLNFVLGIMSGVIHGLRLNLLEFYNWGIKGEGYPFVPFNKREKTKWNKSS
ncbi:MAG: hypothetical protein MI864_26780 [Pseudomonadales bacterium]|nr:hypothetical protein [Pseudomonadales bacterium]